MSPAHGHLTRLPSSFSLLQPFSATYCSLSPQAWSYHRDFTPAILSAWNALPWLPTWLSPLSHSGLSSNVPSFREAFSDHPHHLYVFLKNSSLYLYLVSREFILMAHTYNTNQVPGSVLNTSHILYVNMLNNFPKALQLVIDRAGIESKLLGSRIHYIIHTSM